MHYLLIYAGLFVSIFFEGELVLLSAVIAAHNGYLNLWLVIPIAFSATVASDTIYFHLGRKKAAAYLQQKNLMDKLEGMQARFEKHRSRFLLAYRFVYGFRIVSPLFLGTQKISWREFLQYSIVGTLLWVATFTSIGLVFGELILTYLKDIEQAEFYIIGGLLLFATALIIQRYEKRKTYLRAEKKKN